ncbi:MAG: DUF560 domain-containing protein [Blastochloris viridis]|uniref:DUF560 domain-containing protein n=1 Tax=Blastochloris viridis TaxID=1079 RepID=A0A6N4RBK4_BLAVI|nr:MAG: DUF560 domain-containing protein [Blastochloris viridis]
MSATFTILTLLTLTFAALTGHAESPLGIIENTTTHTDLSNPRTNTAHGLKALDEGLTTEAIAAFERVLAVEPNNMAVRTELARAYALLGDNAAAARELETVATSPQTPAGIKDNLHSYTSLLTQSLRGGPRTYRATAQIGLGADSNINTATNSSYMVLPALAALGPAKLDDSAQTKSSLYSEASANLTVRQPLSPAWAVYAGADASHKQAFVSNDFNQSTLSAETGVQHTSPEGRRLTLGLSARQFWYGNESYSQTYAVTGNWFQPLGVHTALSTYASAAHSQYPDLPAQDADRLTLGSTLHAYYGNLSAYAGLYGGTESAEADINSQNFLGTTLGAEYLLFPTLSTYTEARYEHRDYEGYNPTFLTTRDDNQLDLSLGMAYALSSHFSLRPSIGYRYANSNIPMADYTRWQTIIALRYTRP